MSHNHTNSDDEQLLTAIQGSAEGQNTDGDDENQQLDAAAAATNENVEVLPAENANATALVPLHKQFRVWFGGVAILGTIVALIVVLPGEGNQSIPTPAPSLSLIPSVSQQPTTTLYQIQRRGALVALYDAANGDEWDDSTNWLSDAPVCEWYGIFCNNDDDVVKINLYINNLQGSIPSELGLLTDLGYLRLYYNSLTGSVPSELGLLNNLEYLYLSSNSLTGSIPSEMGLMSNLEVLDLDNNSLTGSIPSELGLLVNLVRLDLDRNSLTGTLPDEVCALRDYNGGNLVGLGADCEEEVTCPCCNYCV